MSKKPRVRYNYYADEAFYSISRALHTSPGLQFPINKLGFESPGWKSTITNLICPGLTSYLLPTESWAGAKNIFMIVWRCNQLVSGFLANDHLPPVSRQPHLSAYDKDDEMKQEAVHRSLGIYLMAEEISEHV